ncbi:MAG: family 78 glycoside hydrolase catalytic domain [Clostridia bacterium]|nr:family 78 glycoside hydrolase catalytic domain [Clostridia bacterium]
MAFENAVFIKPNEVFDRNDLTYAPMLRRCFSLEKKPQKAVLFVAGLGYGCYYLNEKEVTEDRLVAPFGDYRKTVWYTTYDVTDKLLVGENIFAVMLGNGWYNEGLGTAWDFDLAEWRDLPKLILSLECDGETVLVSDENWLYSMKSPVIFNQLREGEHFDARLYDPTWKSLSFDDSAWKRVKIDDTPPKGILRECTCEPIREIASLSPVSVQQIGAKRYLYDFGRNISGYARLSIKQNAGDKIVLRYAEQVHREDGTPRFNDMDNPHYYKRGEFARDIFICSENAFKWKPSFTYHGFRYIEVLGLEDENATCKTLTAIEVHQDMATRSSFSCSSALMTKLFLLGQRATLSNTFYMPTDCPTREKLGWMNDAQSSADQFLTDFEMEHVLTKWWQDILDAQTEEGELPGIVPTPGWGYHWGNGPVSEGTLFEIPYRIYLHTGDDTLLRKGLPYFKKSLAYFDSRRDENGDILYGLDDWAAPCPEEEKVGCAFINHVLYIKCLGITLLSARLCGEETAALEARYGTETRTAKARYLAEDGSCVIDKQTAAAMMIYFDLYDDIAPLAAQLSRLVREKDFHHDCGMVGLRYLYLALNKAGLHEYAYKIIHAKGFPSYSAWVEDGATTLYEYWDSTTSKNHHMYSDFMSWIVKTVLGIAPSPSAPGFARVDIAPFFFEDLDFAEGACNTVRGRISVRWEREDERVRLTAFAAKGIEAYLFGARIPEGETVVRYFKA